MRAPILQLVVVLAAVLVTQTSSILKASAESIPLKNLPKGALQAAKKLFPGAEIVGATKEDGGKEISYDIELKTKKQTVYVTVNDKGEVGLITKEIPVKALPPAVAKAVSLMYPKARLTDAEEIWDVDGGKQKLDYYNVVIETADKKTVEVEVTPQGKIQDSSAK